MAEQTPITGSFVWTLEDVKTRQDILTGMPVTAKGKVMRYALTVILLAMAIALIGSRISFRSVLDVPYFGLILFAVFVIYLVMIYSRSANLKKGFLQSPDSNKRIDVAFTRDEIIIKAEGIYENKWQWNTIKKVQRNPKGFCFFLAEQAGIWVPMRAFASDAAADAVTALVRQLAQERPSLKYTEIA